MNRADRRRQRAQLTPHQRALVDSLDRMNAIVARDGQMMVSIVGVLDTRTGVIDHRVGIGAASGDGEGIVWPVKAARELAAKFRAHPQAAAEGLAAFADNIDSAADECERRNLAAASPEGRA